MSSDNDIKSELIRIGLKDPFIRAIAGMVAIATAAGFVRSGDGTRAVIAVGLSLMFGVVLVVLRVLMNNTMGFSSNGCALNEVLPSNRSPGATLIKTTEFAQAVSKMSAAPRNSRFLSERRWFSESEATLRSVYSSPGEPRRVAGHQIDFEIDFIARVPFPPGRDLERMRNEQDRKKIRFDGVDRQ